MEKRSNNIMQLGLKIIMVCALFICFSVSAQQKSASGIKKVTEYEQDYDKGVVDGIAKIKAEYIYDASGNLIVETEYKDGKKDHTITYIYDKDNRKTKEIEKNASGKITRTSEYKYENGLKTERITYNGENQIKSKKTFRYEKAE